MAPIRTAETRVSASTSRQGVLLHTRNAGGDCKLPLGGELERLPKPRVAQIVDGEKIIKEKFVELQQAAYKVLASEFRKRVDAIEGQDRKK